MKLIFSFLLFTLYLFALEFKVATYNVENLFDLVYDRTEYWDFKPKNKIWNKRKLEKKLKNISKVIKQLNPDIISLEEIESKKALYLLNQKLRYKYSFFLKNKTSAVGIAILSKYKIVENKTIKIKVHDDYSRPILRSTILIDGKKLIIYTNHWRSKRAAESKRIPYALALKNDIDNLDNEDYIIQGDLNENYNEYQTFKYNRKLNNTFGITAINQILNTTINKNFITKKNISFYNEKTHYNLWLELKEKERFSVVFKNTRSTPDNIIISKTLLDKKNISYINHSFKVFKPKYLFKNHNINRWNLQKGYGYSDHLPIFASFTTTPHYSNLRAKTIIKNNYYIDDLYKQNHLLSSIELKKCTVIYKSKKFTIIKQKNHRSIAIYNQNIDLKLGYSYNIVVNSIDEYFGLKEIKEILDYKKIQYTQNYKNLFLDAKYIDIFDIKYQNEILTNLIGIYKKRYLYLQNGKKIKLYFSKNIIKKIDIKDGTKIKIVSGHLSRYKTKNQISIYKKSDIIKVN